MQVSTQRVSGGVAVIIKAEGLDMLAMTEGGTPEEIHARAEELDAQAARISRRAALYRQAAHILEGATAA